jgi:ABC-type multidrug transport system ATPase subunit
MRLELREVTKTYRGGVQALDGVSLAVDRGLHGLLGPNGAGKSTLMKIACTLLAPTRGTVLVDGADLSEDRGRVRERLGYLGQEWGAPRIARCAEVVDLVLRLRRKMDAAARKKEVERLLGLVGLEALSARKVKALSGGQLRRLGVAQALAGDPELIVMDEPTVGLDPDERVEFRALLQHLGRERTIVLSTHVVADVGNTCGRVSVLSRGRVVFDGTPEQLVATARGKVFDVAVTADVEQAIRERLGAAVVGSLPTASGASLRVHGDVPRGLAATPAEPSLEDAYLLLVPAGGVA